MMKQSFYLAAVAIIMLAGCTAPFKKTTEGIEYKIISDGKGKEIKAGNYFEIASNVRYKGNNKDTVIYNSYEFVNQVIPFDSAGMPKLYYDIFKQIRKGDSIIIKQLSDSFMKKGNVVQQMPFLKKNGYIITSLRVVDIYDTKALGEAASQKQQMIARTKDSIKAAEQFRKDSVKSAAQLKIDDKIIADYLAKNKIQTIKSPKGTYIQIINPGEGNILDTSRVVKVFYTGKLLENGKVFDSNADQPTKPFMVYLGAPEGRGGAIPGWMDALPLLKKGSKAVFYIPSSLAYGAQGAGGDIKPDANLIFEIEIADAISLQQAIAESQAERKKEDAERKRQSDSAAKAEKLNNPPAPKK